MKLVKLSTNRHNAGAARDMAGDFIPFRAPHYSCSMEGIREEFLRASGGVLYLDQFNEFRRQCIDAIISGIEYQHNSTLPLAIIVDTYVPAELTGTQAVLYKEKQDEKLARIEEAIAARFKP